MSLTYCLWQKRGFMTKVTKRTSQIWHLMVIRFTPSPGVAGGAGALPWSRNARLNQYQLSSWTTKVLKLWKPSFFTAASPCHLFVCTDLLQAELTSSLTRCFMMSSLVSLLTWQAGQASQWLWEILTTTLTVLPVPMLNSYRPCSVTTVWLSWSMTPPIAVVTFSTWW